MDSLLKRSTELVMTSSFIGIETSYYVRIPPVIGKSLLERKITPANADTRVELAELAPTCVKFLVTIRPEVPKPMVVA